MRGYNNQLLIPINIFLLTLTFETAPMWFWNTLRDLLVALLALLAVCAVAAVIGSFGFQLRRGLAYARARKAKPMLLRISYGIIGCAAIMLGLSLFQASWTAWLLFAAPVIGGFFGWFLVPGEGD
jgi:uncharacterized membrane protein YuzA (DUF378 family)